MYYAYHTAVGISQDPGPPRGRVVGGEDPEALTNAALVLTLVVGVQVAPVAGSVAAEQLGYQGGTEVQQGAWGGDDCSQLESRAHRRSRATSRSVGEIRSHRLKASSLNQDGP